MLPCRDENQTLRTPAITYIVIASNLLAWLSLQGAGATESLAASICNLGLIPGELTLTVAPGTPMKMGEGLICLTDPGRQFSHLLSSMFLHGSWMHLLGNMWFFWIFGNNVEDSMGRARFVAFYLVCGLAAALAQVGADLTSHLPIVGASGAVSGVMGDYLALYPRVRIYSAVLLGFFFTTIAVPAWLMLAYWMLLQFVGGMQSVPGRGGVAFWAHLGGFIAGVVIVKLFARSDYVEQHGSHHWTPKHLGWRR